MVIQLAKQSNNAVAEEEYHMWCVHGVGGGGGRCSNQCVPLYMCTRILWFDISWFIKPNFKQLVLP